MTDLAPGRRGLSRAVLVLVLAALSGGAARGLPPLRSYAPAGHRQYWAVAQDPRGFMYFGNGDGVVEYDGVAWRVFPLPGRGAVRSLAAAADGTLYVGSQGDFGYFGLASDGARAYVSLLPMVRTADRQFGDVWKTHQTSSGVYFQTNDRIFRWKAGTIRVWRPASAFHFSFVVRDTLYVLDRTRGLLSLHGDTLEPVPGGARLAGDRLYLMLPFTDGKVLVGAREQGLFLHDGRSIEPFATEVAERLHADQLYHGAALPDGTFALATLRGGVAIVDRHGRLLQRLDRSTGLRSDKVTFTFLDRENGLWLAQDGGVARVEIASPLTVHPMPGGADEMVLAVARLGDRLYAGTERGLRFLEPRTDSGEPSIGIVPGIVDQVFHLAPAAGGLLAATWGGVYWVGRDGARLVAPGISSVVLLSSRWPARAYVGQIDGLRVLEGEGTSWRDRGLVEGFAGDTRTLFERRDGGLWIGTRAHGLHRLDIAAGGKPVVRALPSGSGLPVGGVDVWTMGGEPAFLSTQGLHRFDEASATFPFVQWALAPEALGDRRPVFLHDDGHGRIWIATRPDTSGAEPAYDLRVFEQGIPPRRASIGALASRFVARGCLAALTDPSGDTWLGTGDGLLRIETSSRPPPALAGARPVCRAAVLTERRAPGRPLPRDGRLQPGENALRVDCVLPLFTDEAQNELRFRLEGLHSAWSAWAPGGSRVFADLPPGRFRLLVQGRDAFARAAGEAAIAFEVKPRWYQTWGATAGATALIALLAFAAHRTRIAWLERRQRELELLVARRTSDLRESEASYRALFDNASDVIFALDRNGRVVSVNQAIDHVPGFSRESMLGRPLRDFVGAADEAKIRGWLAAPIESPSPPDELSLASPDGQTRIFEVKVRTLDDGGVGRVEGVARDVTLRRTMDDQLRQAQKMEAVGQLAGGVAHDFNNLLTIINGYCDLLLAQEGQDSLRRDLEEIRNAGGRAAALTQQLLAFGRRQRLDLQPVNLDVVVDELRSMLRPMLGEEVELVVQLEAVHWWCSTDPGQIAQALVSLVANARDAMSGAGRLTIRTRKVTLDREGVEPTPPLPAGDYVSLSVTDTGHGIDPTLRARIFEPFFSTKGPGKGTGLGLSATQGIVEQSGGHVAVESALGRGSTFTIYLPRAAEPVTEGSDPQRPAEGRDRASETILVVEDEDAIRSLIVGELRRQGYSVLAFDRADTALATVRPQFHSIRLLVTGVRMPDMSGVELARRLRTSCSGVQVLFVTGHAGDDAAGVGLEPAEAVLQKPFELVALRAAIDRLLGTPVRS